jgi:hypothetical protein
MTPTDADAMVLLRTTRDRRQLASEFGSMKGVSRVDAVRGPYDLVVHATGFDAVKQIEGVSGISAADVCWLPQ